MKLFALLKDGFYGGDLGKAKSSPLTDVLDLIDYKTFTTDYESAFAAMNKEVKK